MSLKATPDLNLPDSKESQAFAALVQVLKNDPILSRTVHTMLHCEGADRDFFMPAHATCPFLEIAPWPTESEWITEGQHKMPLTIRIMCAVRGTKFSNIANFWNAVRLALFPQDADQAALVQAVMMGPNQDLVTKPTITLPAYGAAKDEQGLRMMIADGRILLPLLIKT